MSFLLAGAPLPLPTQHRSLKTSEATSFKLGPHPDRRVGALLSRDGQRVLADLWRCAGSLALAASVSLLVTEGSFYWRGHRSAEVALAGWHSSFPNCYALFMCVTAGCARLSALSYGAASHRLSLRAQR